MIVKDESAVICRCLNSVKHLIDHWIIVDTGSKDDTKELIKSCLEGIPGELHERPWVNFAFNRNEALQLAKGKSPYILFMDADDWLEPQSDHPFPLLSEGAHYVWCGERDVSFLKPQIIKGDLPWTWIGVIHEYLACDAPFSSAILDCVWYRTGRDGGRSGNGNKYLHAIDILQKGLKEDPANHRYVFYLAESYRDAGLKGNALEYYLKRIDMGGWDEEIFWSMFQVAILLQEFKLPWSSVKDSYTRAHQFRPHRCEPIYFLAAGFNEQKDYQSAYQILQKIGGTRKEKLFNLTWIEEYGLLFQLSISTYHLGHYQEALSACDALLANDHLPLSWKRQVENNRSLTIAKLEKGST